jgi:2-methylisocitrate lyase-like PEP mutase family enzyme
MPNPARELRSMLSGSDLVVAPGVYDGISAHLVRESGFRAAYFSGGLVAASGYGLPDLGLVTASQMAERLAVVVEAAGIPVIADADTGYGNAMHVALTVRHYERAGAAAIQLEDQSFPKRCGHLDDKRLVDVTEFIGKLHAALDTRTGDTVIIARTDAVATLGIDEAIDRGRRYAAEGADVIFVEALENREQMRRAVTEINAPVLFNVVPGGKSPDITHDELASLGFRLVIHPGAIGSPVLAAAAAALVDLGGKPVVDVEGVRGMFRTVGLDVWVEIDHRYA